MPAELAVPTRLVLLPRLPAGWRDLRAETGMSTRSEPVPALLGRQRERAALVSLLGVLRSGLGRALVVRGEAGVG